MQTNHSSYKNLMIGILALVVIIEAMGMFLVLPLFPGLLLTDHSVFGSTFSEQGRTVLYALTMLLWSLGAFLGAPVLGCISDSAGRKSVLLLCLIATVTTYLLGGLAIYSHGVFIFFFARLLSGFFSGSYDIAQAAVVDLSTPETKARNIGIMALALSSGFVLGPLIASVVTLHADSHTAYITPFIIAAGIALISTMGIAICYKDSKHFHGLPKIEFSRLTSSVKFIFTDKRVRAIAISYGLLNLMFAHYLMGIPLILSDQFGFDTKALSKLINFLGLGLAMSILVIQPLVMKRLALKQVFVSGALISSGILFFLAWHMPLTQSHLMTFLFGLFEMVTYSSLITMASNAVTTEEQGQVMGGLASMVSLAFFATNVWLPIAYAWHPATLIMIAGLAVGSAAVIILVCE